MTQEQLKLAQEQEKHWDALGEKQAAAFERDGRVLFQDATVRAVDKVMAEFEAQPEQEPVACGRCKQLEEQAYDLLGQLKVANIKLAYAHPPQRTWVGLTDDEKEILSEYADGNTWTAIELTVAKLKEKNHV